MKSERCWCGHYEEQHDPGLCRSCNAWRNRLLDARHIFKPFSRFKRDIYRVPA